jgi:hypothetical protein
MPRGTADHKESYGLFPKIGAARLSRHYIDAFELSHRGLG